MELPEIKSMRRQIVRKVIGQKIIDFSVPKLKLRGGEISDFRDKIVKSYIKDIYIFGEEIVFKLASGYYIMANMQSTGFFILKNPPLSKGRLEGFAGEVQSGLPNDKHIRAEFVLANESKLLFIDSRGSSYFTLFNQKQLNQAKLKLGVDPLGKEFNYNIFLDLLKGRTTSIKNFLINDSVFLGIGNIYSDEICFEARLSPNRGMKTLRRSEINRLYKAICKILKKSMEYDGLELYLPTSLKNLRFDNFLRVYNKEGESCWRCKSGVIKKEKLGQLFVFYCPLCQK